MTSGFVGTPPPLDGLWADDQAVAWELYRANAETHGYPIPVCGRYLVPRAIRTVNEILAAQAVAEAPGPITTPHKGSSAEASRLHDWDKPRISGRVARQMARRRGRDRDDDDQPQQATLFG